MSLARMLRWLGGFGATSAAVLAFSPAAYGQWFGLGCSKCEKCPPPFVHHSEGPPHCPVPPPGPRVPHPPPPPYPPPPGRWIEPAPAPVQTLPKPRTTESET